MDSLYCFGGFTLDLRRRGLFRNGERIHLTSKPFDVLTFLVQSEGRLVEKSELLDAVWNGVFVTDDNLVQAIMEIRRALGDDKHDPHFIETVPRHGYRFLAEVHRAAVTEESDGARHAAGRGLTSPARTGLILPILVILGAVVAVGVYHLPPGSYQALRSYLSRERMPFGTASFRRLTTSGEVTGAAVSPDGKYVVYARRADGQESLWLAQVATASEVRITDPTELLHQGITFSPDGSSFYYVVRDRKQLGELYQMDTVGGTPKRLIADVDSAVTFSPDGKRLSFFRGYPEKQETTLVIANIDGTQAREFAARKGDSFPTLLDAAPAWSPAGTFISCPVTINDEKGRYTTVINIDAERGAATPATSRRWSQVGHMAWSRDGTGVIMTARESKSDPSQIWHLSYPDGEARRITNDLSNYSGVSLTRDGPVALVTLRTDALASIAIDADKSDIVDVSVSSDGAVVGVCWTPDGRVVYSARLKNKQDIYAMGRDGTEPRRLTANAGDNTWPSVSPDGRYVVFISNRTGTDQIWRMDLDGGNIKQLTFDSGARWPRCAPDGQWVYYASRSDSVGLLRISIEGGDPVQLTDKSLTSPAVSPDGRMVATGYREDPGAEKTAIYSSDTGALLKVLDLWSAQIRWTPDGKGLTYIDRYRTNIVSEPIDAGPKTVLTRFKDGSITAFDLSQDGALLCSRRKVIADAVLITDPSAAPVYPNSQSTR